MIAETTDTPEEGGAPWTGQQVTTGQFSLFELLFVMTLCAVFVGVYIYISPGLALVGGITLVSAAAVRFSGVHSLLAGGLVGFFTASIAGWLFILPAMPGLPAVMGLLLFCPTVGYVLGACIAGLRDDSI